MKNNGKKRTLREEWLLIKRAIGIIEKIMPHYWLWQTICSFTAIFTPYFGIYMSASMLNELAGECNIKKLLILAAITVCGNFALSLISRIIESKRTMKDCFDYMRHEAYLISAQNHFQYEHLENPDVVLMRSKIFAAFNATGGGLMKVKWNILYLLNNVINLIFSVSLTVSLFTMTAKGEFDGILAFVNSPFSSVAVIALIAANTVLSCKIMNKKNVEYGEAVADLGKQNTRMSAYRRYGTDMIVFGLNRVVLEEYRKYFAKPMWVVNTERVSIKYGSLSTVLGSVQTIVLYLFVAAKAFMGAFGIGNFVLYQQTISRFIDSASRIAGAIGDLKYNNFYLEQLYEYLDLPNNMYNGRLAVEKRDDIDYEIEFRDVSFKYPRTDAWVLRHVNIKFKIGDKLAIVGENGSGKTTFIKLLCRLYDPTEGKILLNGIDITRYRYNEYMALFSVVFQDYTLFEFPLGEIVSANTEYDETRVRDCLIRAGLGDKLASLDSDTNAKEKDTLKRAVGRSYDSEGIDFSGGERQKIALARALYKDAPFVVLDEPTAALDPIAEAEVYANFNKLVKDKTSVFISHRLSSCRFCDSIAVFDHGSLVQLGSHDALVNDENGKYSKLWHAQAQYYEK